MSCSKRSEIGVSVMPHFPSLIVASPPLADASAKVFKGCLHPVVRVIAIDAENSHEGDIRPVMFLAPEDDKTVTLPNECLDHSPLRLANPSAPELLLKKKH